jgi:phosphatidylglycerol:prolipoprotein diacylglycerol transferase
LKGRGFHRRWYSIAYIAGILVGWWYLLKLIASPAARWRAACRRPRLLRDARHHPRRAARLCDLLRAGMFLNPLQILKLWDGGMSFHGGMIGTTLGLILFARQHKLNWLRIHDYLACCVPFGLFFGRLANFVNGELWGKPPTCPGRSSFRALAGDVARHPSQLYEAGLEGIVLFAILWFAFWRPRRATIRASWSACSCCSTAWRASPWNSSASPIHSSTHHLRGRPSIWASCADPADDRGGIYLIATSAKRRERVEPIAGSESVA